MPTEYVFDSASDLGDEQIRSLSAMYDDVTATVLDGIGVRSGQTCLDIGAGSGSVATMLAERVAPDGSVIATDLESEHLSTGPGVTVLTHDINDGVPPGGPYDLIHARLVLMHLEARERLLPMLAGGLNPGGWLAVGDLGARLPRAIEAPSPADAAIFERVIRIGMTLLAPKVGMSTTWADQLHRSMSDAGLIDVQTRRIARTCGGGSPGCLLFRSYARQHEGLLQEVGVSGDEIGRFVELMSDPRMRVEFFELIYVSGRTGGVIA